MSAPTDTRGARIGLHEWMNCVLERVAKVRPDFRAKDVHELRVALRRCRTMADALREVTPDPAWRKIKKLSRDLFHALGGLRDVQVQLAWIKELYPQRDSGRDPFARHLRDRETGLRQEARNAVEEFDTKQWRKLRERTKPEAHFFPVESVVFQRLALSQLNGSIASYDRAKRTRGSAAWHRTRIEVKKFRYLVENFLPQRRQAWSDDLKNVQNLLGDLHDLDVLRIEYCRFSANGAGTNPRFVERIAETRNERLSGITAKLSGPHSPFRKWLAGFQPGRPLVAVSFPVAERRTA